MRKKIQAWHGGQLFIVWLVLGAVAVLAIVLAAGSLDYSVSIGHRHALAVHDSLAREELKREGLTRDSLLKMDPYNVEFLLMKRGIQDTSFRAPTGTEVRAATFVRYLVAYPLFLLAALSLPLALGATWIWLGATHAPDSL